MSGLHKKLCFQKLMLFNFGTLTISYLTLASIRLYAHRKVAYFIVFLLRQALEKDLGVIEMTQRHPLKIEDH